MAEYSKCPYCGNSINKLKANQMPAEYRVVGMHNTDSRNCWVFSCPHMSCGKIISVQHDPIQQRISLAQAIADLVAKKLRGG
jgi:predicted DCC family thiol-disulfide oxidoreductase YuxK